MRPTGPAITKGVRSARAFLLTTAIVATQLSCGLLVGSYSVGAEDAVVVDTGEDAGVADTTATRDVAMDTTRSDVMQPETPAGGSSCRTTRTDASANGTYDLTVGGKKVTVYCDMLGNGGGWTLVATRSSATPASVWTTGGVAKDKTPLPEIDEDRIVDVDWASGLGFSELAYEIVGSSKTTRVLFRTLSETQRTSARTALTLNTPRTERPSCSIDGGATIANCSNATDTGGTLDAVGWLFDPTGLGSCFFAHKNHSGAGQCSGAFPSSGARARVWVR
jgi:hypothetical protein